VGGGAVVSASDLPYSEPIRLHQIGAGLTRTLEPDVAARGRIAKALDLGSLDRLSADIDLKPSPSGWRLEGRLRASLAQTCGITLDPLPLDFDERFTASFAESPDAGDQDEIVVDLEEDDGPDLIEDGRLDLGQVVVEQLALRLDPFPRKPGAEFVQPDEPAEISPFAVLKGLKTDDNG